MGSFLEPEMGMILSLEKFLGPVNFLELERSLELDPHLWGLQEWRAQVGVAKDLW